MAREEEGVEFLPGQSGGGMLHRRQFGLQTDMLRGYAELGLPSYFDPYCLGQDEGS